MTGSNGYKGMGETERSEQLLATAIAGGDLSNADSREVEELVSAIRVETALWGAPRGAETHIAAAAASVPIDPPAPRAARAGKPRRPKLRRRMVILASALGLIVATAGIGIANDHVSPGHPLYGLEKALEAIGIGNGGAAERAEEVLDLLEQGEIGLALGHAAETIATIPGEQSAPAAGEALQEAAEHIGAVGEPAPTGVEDLLAYLAENIGDPDGETIKLIARIIKDSVVTGTPVQAPSPGGPPVSIPGPPESFPLPIPIPDPPSTDR